MKDNEKMRRRITVVWASLLIGWVFGNVLLVSGLNLSYEWFYQKYYSLAAGNKGNSVPVLYTNWQEFDCYYDNNADPADLTPSAVAHSYGLLYSAFSFTGRDISSLKEIGNYDDQAQRAYNSYPEYLWALLFKIDEDEYVSTYVTDLNDQVIKEPYCGLAREYFLVDDHDIEYYINMDSAFTDSEYDQIMDLLYGEDKPIFEFVIDEYAICGVNGELCVPVKVSIFQTSESEPVTIDLSSKETFKPEEIRTTPLEFSNEYLVFHMPDRPSSEGGIRCMEWVAEMQQQPLGGGYEEKEVGFGADHTQYLRYETSELKVYSYRRYNGTHSMIRTFVVLEGLLSLALLPLLFVFTGWMIVEKRKAAKEKKEEEEMN